MISVAGAEDINKGCGFDEWYRSFKESIMLDGRASHFFNAVSQKAINEAIDKIAGPYTEDKISPQVKFESLVSEGQQGLRIKAQATDNKGVAYAQFWVDDVFLKTAYIAPYEFRLDTSSWKDNERHVLRLKAYDVSGNIGEADKTINEAIHKVTLGGDLKKNMTISKETRVDINVPEENKDDIIKIEVFVDDKLTGTVGNDSLKELYKDISAQYGFWVDPKGYYIGTHKFYAKIYTGITATISNTIPFYINKNSFEKDDAYKDRDFPSDVTPTPALSKLYSQCLEICGQNDIDCSQKCDNLYKGSSSATGVIQPTVSAPTSVPGGVSSTVPANISTPIISKNPISVNLHSLGDADGDGKISLNDAAIWINEFRGFYATKTSDFDGSGLINTDDYNIWRDSMSNPNLPH